MWDAAQRVPTILSDLAAQAYLCSIHLAHLRHLRIFFINPEFAGALPAPKSGASKTPTTWSTLT